MSSPQREDQQPEKPFSESGLPVQPPAEGNALVGRRFAHYQILDRIGHGSMGVVYKAHDLQLDRIVALKILPEETMRIGPESIQRFLREARAAAALKHPNVVSIYHMGHESNRYFIEMEYIDGGSLEETLRTLGRLAPVIAALVIRDCALALAATHAKGIIHRDIKPGNILLEIVEKGAVPQLPYAQSRTDPVKAKLCDFGLAHLKAGSRDFGPEGYASGSALYISPEQAQGLPADPRSDIYSLGCVFYELLTGKPPYQGKEIESLVRQHIHGRVPSVRAAAPDVPEPYAAIAERMMAKKPHERFQTAAEVAAQLNTALAVGAEVPPAIVSRKKTTRRAVWLGAAFIGILLVCLGAFVLYRWDSTPSPYSPSEFDDLYLTAAATGEKIPHPLSRKTYPVSYEGKEILTPIGMVYVPAGRSKMGMYDDREELGLVERQVSLDAYFIGKYEVTNAEYMIFVQARNHKPPYHWKDGKIPAGKENHPVVGVNWYDAKAYCEWVSRETGRRVHLPTEAQWEKAASWDPVRKRQNLYPWGDDWDPNACANCFQMGYSKEMDWNQWWENWLKSPEGEASLAAGGNTSPVGSFPKDRSLYGCYDMASNVWEWCSDWYQADYYKVGPETNPQGPEKGASKVVRSGIWWSRGSTFPCSFRRKLNPRERNMFCGFRLAQTP